MFHYETILGPVRQQMEAFFGSCEEIKAQGTWQFYPDYSKYDASAVDLEEKQWYRANQWPKDLQAAYHCPPLGTYRTRPSIICSA